MKTRLRNLTTLFIMISSFQLFAASKMSLNKKPQIDKVEVVYANENINLYVHGKEFGRLEYVKFDGSKIRKFSSKSSTLITVRLDKEYEPGNYELEVKTKGFLKGSKGNAWVGLGEIGPQGEVGSGGPRGPQGQSGSKGETGLTGKTGLTGEKGDIGERGKSGTPGIMPAKIKAMLERISNLEIRMDNLSDNEE